MKDIAKLSILDYLSILRRRVWYLIVTAVLVSAGVYVYVQEMPSVYRSGVLIAVAPRVVPEDYIRSIDHQTSNDVIGLVAQQLQDRTFAERIVREFQFAGRGPAGLDGAINAVRGTIQMSTLSPTLFRLSYTSTNPATAQGVARRLGEMVIELNASFRKQRVQVADRFLGEEERQAGDVLERAETKLAQFRAQHFPGIGTDVNPFTLGVLQTQFDNAEKTLESLNASRKSLEIRIDEQRSLSTVRQTPAAMSPATETRYPTAAATPLEEKLAKKREEYELAAKKYTPNYPGVTALAQEVKDLEGLVAESRGRAVTNSTTEPKAAPQNVLIPADSSFALYEAEMRIEMDQINKNVLKAEEAKKDLEARISLYKYQLTPPPAVSQELAALNRDYESAKQVFNSLNGKKQDLAMTARVEASDENVLFKILDPADLPRSPAGPNRPLYTLAGIMAGILLGFGAVFTREYLDQTIQDEEEAISELGLPVLTCIPEMPARKEMPIDPSNTKKATLNLVAPLDSAEQVAGRSFHLHSIDPYMRNVMLDAAGIAGEQFRLLRAALSSLQKQRYLKTLLVASAIPNDGKTFIASCLAGILAQEGKKVLLVDADLRRGTIGSVLGVDRSSAGLSNVIRSAAVLEQCFIKCAEMNLYFLPAGDVSENPADLLSSPNLEQHLRRVEELFDYVIIDSPPVLALTDAKILAPLCDAALLVVNCTQTPRTLAKEAIQRIGRDRVIGVVLNRVRKIRASTYYSYYHQQIAPPKQLKK